MIISILLIVEIIAFMASLFVSLPLGTTLSIPEELCITFAVGHAIVWGISGIYCLCCVLLALNL